MHDAHFCGLYRGICIDNNDPESRNRIRLQVPQIFGDLVLPYWAWPCLAPGWRQGLVKPHGDHVFTDNDGGASATETLVHTNNHTLQSTAPSLNEGVWVMFEGGDPDRPVWIGTF